MAKTELRPRGGYYKDDDGAAGRDAANAKLQSGGKLGVEGQTKPVGKAASSQSGPTSKMGSSLLLAHNIFDRCVTMPTSLLREDAWKCSKSAWEGERTWEASI